MGEGEAVLSKHDDDQGQPDGEANRAAQVDALGSNAVSVTAIDATPGAEGLYPEDVAINEAWAIKNADTNASEDLDWYSSPKNKNFRRGPLKDYIRRASAPFDKLRAADPKRYAELSSDEMQEFAQEVMASEWVIEDWGARASHYAQSAEKLGECISSEVDVLSGEMGEDLFSPGGYFASRPKFANLLRNGIPLSGSEDEDREHALRVARHNSNYFVNAFGMSTDWPRVSGEDYQNADESQAVETFLADALLEVSKGRFNRTPKQVLEIYQKTLVKISEQSRSWAEGARQQQDELLERFKNGEDIRVGDESGEDVVPTT